MCIIKEVFGSIISEECSQRPGGRQIMGQGGRPYVRRCANVSAWPALVQMYVSIGGREKCGTNSAGGADRNRW